MDLQNVVSVRSLRFTIGCAHQLPSRWNSRAVVLVYPKKAQCLYAIFRSIITKMVINKLVFSASRFAVVGTKNYCATDWPARNNRQRAIWWSVAWKVRANLLFLILMSCIVWNWKTGWKVNDKLTLWGCKPVSQSMAQHDYNYSYTEINVV